MGRSRAVTVRIPRNSRNKGFRILPTQVKMPEGRREKYSTIRKNSAENTQSASFSCSGGSNGKIPTLKETVAVLGMAKSGPMVRYSTQVKNRL